MLFCFGLKGIESCPYSPVGCTLTSSKTGQHLYSLFAKRKENAVIPFKSTTSSRTAYRSRRLFYSLQQKSSLTHFVAPPSKNKTARPLRASSTTSALRCAGFCFVWGSFHAWRIRTARAPPKKTAPIGCCLFWCSEDDRIMSAHASSRVHETVRTLSNAMMAQPMQSVIR